MNRTSRPTCVLTGEQSLLVQCGEALLADGWSVACVFTDQLQLMRWARGRGIATRPAAHLFSDPEPSPEVDYLFSIGNLTVLPESVIDAPRRAAINFHDGPLPEMRGLNVPNWAILEGHDTHAVTWHRMSADVDRGEILARRDFAIGPSDTALGLNARCFEAGLDAFRALLAELGEESAEGCPQDGVAGVYFGRDRRLPNGGVVDWNEPAERLLALARATDVGPYDNPFGLPRIWLGDRFVIPGEISEAGDEGLSPGQLRQDGDRLLAGTGSAALSLRGLREMCGKPLDPSVAAALGTFPSRRLDDAEQAMVSAATAQEPHWVRLRQAETPLRLDWLFHDASPEACRHRSRVRFSGRLDEHEWAAVVILAILRLGGEHRGLIAMLDEALASFPLVEPYRPLAASVTDEESVSDFTSRVAMDCASMREQGPLLQDQALRFRADQGSTPPVAIATGESPGAGEAFDLVIRIDADTKGATIHTCFNRACTAQSVDRFEQALAQVMAATKRGADQPATAVDIVSDADRELLLDHWNPKATTFRDECVHHAFLRAAAERPGTTAVQCGDTALTYSELEQRARALALHLQTLGIGADDRVGMCLERDEQMVVALLGVLLAGAAYLPLDPDYPVARLRHILDDARPAVTLVSGETRQRLEGAPGPFLVMDGVPEPDPDATLADTITTANLAYVIYTSGSTGAPKGVMVEHRNVANFFAGMDERIPLGPSPRWLAVTSLSFDISVLELLWTLTRGVGVVLYTGADRLGDSAVMAARPHHYDTAIDFSLFYFASDEGEKQADKYRLLIEGARFADAHGFAAVWTPERHFHAFGGLYPNPSVVGAAIATITEHIQIRAGSCVLPLHDPIRIAEEWALVDNLSNGRAGISFASGWQPDDFVLAPDNYEQRHDVMAEGIEAVRAMWRGDTVRRTNPLGKEVELSTLPRPVQAELPFWVTAAGNPATFRAAGEMGANLLTHLLGQSTDELAGKIETYRTAWREAGHAGEGVVTLMLHTFVGDDEAAVRAHVHEPLKGYLRSSVGLIRKFADTFPAFRNRGDDAGGIDFDALPDEDMEALLEFAFERYYRESGMFGSPERCVRLVDTLKGIGVNEIACLVDFGVPSDVVLAHLPGIEAVKQRAAADIELPPGSVADLIHSRDITHMQCTPSQARMLIADPDNHPALRRLQGWLVGGEALPEDLAERLRSVATGAVTNLYGPTETTIWSTTWTVPETPESIRIGTPIANTRCYVLDEALRLRPPGAPGELVIGGLGVTRGYFDQQALTDSRFVEDPYSESGGRMYRTGDRVRWEAGELCFLGRIDDQIKVRGYRIELGDIEAALNAFDGPQQAVAAIRTDTAGEPIIAAYVVMPPGVGLDEVSLRRHLNRSLPEFMLPQVFVEVDDVPLTPNGKVDRRSLPAIDAGRRGGQRRHVPPATDMEHALVSIWSEVLSLDQVGTQDTFFELGGDSLAAVRAAVRIREKTGRRIPLETLLRATLAQSARSLDAAPAIRRGQRSGSTGGEAQRRPGWLRRLTGRSS